MRLQHVDLHSSQNEVTEAAVQGLLETEMVERIDEVGPVEMSVYTEHLAEDSLADVVKLSWEATALANPVAGASKLGEGGVERCGTSWDGSV